MEFIKINDLHRATRADSSAISEAINGVLESGWFVLGPEVEAFETEFARYVGAASCVAVGNGTDALELALRSVGTGPGSRVAVVANAGFYSSAACLAIGAEPVYVDVDRATGCMSPESLTNTLEPGIDAVVVTHLYGQAAALDAIVPACRAAGVPLVEDCAQAVGARLDDQPLGSWGDAAAFSFYPTKNLGALGDGGAIVTSRSDVAALAFELRQYGWTCKYNIERSGGRNSRLDEIQAAVLRLRLPLLEQRNRRRQQIGAAIADAARQHGAHTFFSDGPHHVAHLSVLVTPNRDQARHGLAALGIGTDIHYPIPDHQQPLIKRLGLAGPSLPVTEDLASSVLSVPCYPELTDPEIDRICEAITSVLNPLSGEPPSVDSIVHAAG